MKTHEISDTTRLELEISLYGQQKAWRARNEVVLQSTNDHLLELLAGIEKPDLTPTVVDKGPEHALMGAIEFQRQSMRDGNQVALAQANQQILDAKQRFEATSPDKR
jgi:hypothetical protein